MVRAEQSLPACISPVAAAANEQAIESFQATSLIWFRPRVHRWPARVVGEEKGGKRHVRFFEGGVKDRVADVPAENVELFYRSADPSSYRARASNTRV